MRAARCQRDARGRQRIYRGGSIRRKPPTRFARRPLRRDSSETSANGRRFHGTAGTMAGYSLRRRATLRCPGITSGGSYQPAVGGGRIGLGGFPRHEAHARNPHERDPGRSQNGGRPTWDTLDVSQNVCTRASVARRKVAVDALESARP